MKLLLSIGVIIIGIGIVGLLRTRKTQTGNNQAKFLAGRGDNLVLDGFYKGTVDGYHGSWQGKTFYPQKSQGINNFNVKGTETHKYPFKTYSGKGLRDTNLHVLKIDYALAGNPFWVRFVLDEVVETEPGKYLGKMHVRIIPGLPFSLGYFRLEHD